MRCLNGPPDQCINVIDKFLIERLSYLKGKERKALLSEFKEWLIEGDDPDSEIWTIPDLTDAGLRDFFKRAISKNSP